MLDIPRKEFRRGRSARGILGALSGFFFVIGVLVLARSLDLAGGVGCIAIGLAGFIVLLLSREWFGKFTIVWTLRLYTTRSAKPVIIAGTDLYEHKQARHLLDRALRLLAEDHPHEPVPRSENRGIVPGSPPKEP
jgi:hypothetical protein